MTPSRSRRHTSFTTATRNAKGIGHGLQKPGVAPALYQFARDTQRITMYLYRTLDGDGAAQSVPQVRLVHHLVNSFQKSSENSEPTSSKKIIATALHHEEVRAKVGGAEDSLCT